MRETCSQSMVPSIAPGHYKKIDWTIILENLSVLNDVGSVSSICFGASCRHNSARNVIITIFLPLLELGHSFHNLNQEPHIVPPDVPTAYRARRHACGALPSMSFPSRPAFLPASLLSVSSLVLRPYGLPACRWRCQPARLRFIRDCLPACLLESGETAETRVLMAP